MVAPPPKIHHTLYKLSGGPSLVRNDLIRTISWEQYHKNYQGVCVCERPDLQMIWTAGLFGSLPWECVSDGSTQQEICWGKQYLPPRGYGQLWAVPRPRLSKQELRRATDETPNFHLLDTPGVSAHVRSMAEGKNSSMGWVSPRLEGETWSAEAKGGEVAQSSWTQTRNELFEINPLENHWMGQWNRSGLCEGKSDGWQITLYTTILT